MIALNGYGSRFDRIEQNLTDDKITVRTSQLFQDITGKINSITNTLIEQIGNMNNTISSDIDDIKSSVCNGYSSDIASDIDDVKGEISSLRYTIDEIYSSLSDKYDYDSLASNIENIKSVLNDIKDASESARYMAES